MLAPPVHCWRVEPHQLGSIPGGPRPPALVASSRATRLLERSLGRNKTRAASHAAGRRLLVQVGR